MHTLLLALLFLAPGNLSAQVSSSDSLTLEQVWNIVDSENRQLKLSDLMRSESVTNVEIAKSDRLPSLNVSGNVVHNTKFLIYTRGWFATPDYFAVSKYGYGFGYSLSLNVYEGGKYNRNIQIKREESLRQQNEYDLQRNNMHYSAAIVFYDLYKFLQFRDFLSAEITAEKKQLQTIESFYRNGTVLKSDVLRSHVKLSQLELSLSDLNKQIKVASQRLNILMAHGNGDSVAIVYHDSTMLAEISENGNYMDYVEIALSKSPAYKITLNDVNLANLNIKQVKANILPKVSLFSYYTYTYPQVSYYPYSNDFWSFGQTGLRVTFPLDNLYRNKHLHAKAKTESAQQTERVRIEQDELIVDIKEAYLQYQQASEAVKSAQENIEQNTESVRVIRNSYLSQESLLTDLLDAENTLLESKFALTSAIVNLRLSHVRLLAKTGIL
ncbi:TolC family protein [Chitinophaga sp. CF118]|uniref:TolC family protein n=1 Tax=Chitinophaga sp. CF118 TaxID=1884367 RepID=UPI000B7F62C8|nr:TolC family protein [Chitinophaga sp. CF118]